MFDTKILSLLHHEEVLELFLLLCESCQRMLQNKKRFDEN